MATKPRAIGAGLVALDVIVPDAAAEEKKFVQAGGSCGNVMAILAYLGWSAAPVARLDESPNSVTIRDDLEQWGVDTRWAQGEATGSTPLILQINHNPGTDAARHKFHWRCLNCSGWYPRFKPFKKTLLPEIEAHEKKVSAYYFDRAFPASIELAKHMRDQGAVIIFEPNGVRDERQFEAALSVADVVKYSHERMAPQADLVADPDVWLQIETIGRDGLRFRLRDEDWRTLEAVPAPFVIDTAGAGDWCSAALIDGCFRRGRESLKTTPSSKVQQALRLGQSYASLNCAYAGARGLMFALDEETATEYAHALLRGKVAKAKHAPKAAERVAAEYCGTCEPPQSSKVPSRKAVRARK